nr:hypothetical protein Iba_chr05aCG8370 [Ipomoea batatas]
MAPDATTISGSAPLFSDSCMVVLRRGIPAKVSRGSSPTKQSHGRWWPSCVTVLPPGGRQHSDGEPLWRSSPLLRLKKRATQQQRWELPLDLGLPSSQQARMTDASDSSLVVLGSSLARRRRISIDRRERESCELVAEACASEDGMELDSVDGAVQTADVGLFRGGTVNDSCRVEIWEVDDPGSAMPGGTVDEVYHGITVPHHRHKSLPPSRQTLGKYSVPPPSGVTVITIVSPPSSHDPLPTIA